MTTKNWEILIDDYDFDWGTTPSLRCAIVLDPEVRSITTYNAIGGGWTFDVQHHRAAMVGIPLGAVSSEVRDVLQAYADDLDAWADRYLGTAWDGSNHVGRWAPLSDRYDDDLRGLRDALAEVACYSDPDDWLAECPPEDLAKQINSAGGVDAWALIEQREGRDQGWWMTLDRLRDSAESLIREWVEELGEELSD